MQDLPFKKGDTIGHRNTGEKIFLYHNGKENGNVLLVGNKMNKSAFDRKMDEKQKTIPSHSFLEIEFIQYRLSNLKMINIIDAVSTRMLLIEKE